MASRANEHVRVLYDYDYVNTDGNKVSIRVGEEYIVLKKTSSEWWYVLKRGERKHLYVPANYVEPIHKTVIALGDKAKPVAPPVPAKGKKPPPRPPKPKTRLPKPSDEEEVLKELDDILDCAFDNDPLFENGSGDSREPAEVHIESQSKRDSHVFESDKEKSASLKRTIAKENQWSGENSATSSSLEDLVSSDSRDSLDKGLVEGDGLDTEVKIDANSNIEPQPDYANVTEIRAGSTLGPKEADEGPAYANLSELRGMSPVAPAPPRPGPAEQPVRPASAGWAVYAHPGSGRDYYHHQSTAESSWTCPPGVQDPEAEPPTVSSQRLSTASSSAGAPVGWRQSLNDAGETVFISDNTADVWRSSTDTSGRKYYYRPGSVADSVWELPEVDARA